jgi:hypothetical protein
VPKVADLRFEVKVELMRKAKAQQQQLEEAIRLEKERRIQEIRSTPESQEVQKALSQMRLTEDECIFKQLVLRG